MKKTCIYAIVFLLMVSGCKKKEAPALSSIKVISSFTFRSSDNPSYLQRDFAGIISGDSIKIDLPAGTNITSLRPDIIFTATSLSPANKAAQNFSSPVSYVVTGEDGSIIKYIVVVNLISNTKNIISFVFKAANNTSLSADLTGIIGNDTIRVNASSYNGASSLLSTIVHNGKSINPSGTLVQNFTVPVSYTVYAEDGSSHIYTVIFSANKTLYVGGMDNNLYALDATTGFLLWKYTSGGGILASPTVDNGLVIFGCLDHYIYAVDAQSGILKWKTLLTDAVYGSPVTAGGTVYATVSYTTIAKNIFAIDEITGNIIWSGKIGNSIKSGPVIYNGKFYVSAFDAGVACLDINNGSLIWYYNTIGTVTSDPAIVNGVVYASGEYYKSFALNAATGAEIWKYGDLNLGGNSSPTLYSGSLYSATYDGYLFSFNPANGSVNWKFKFDGGHGQFVSPVAADGIIYAGVDDNVLYAVNTSNGTLAWKIRTSYFNHGSSIDSAAAVTVSNGLVYTGGAEGIIRALKAIDGTVKWSYQTNGSVYSGPCITTYSGTIVHPGNSGQQQ